MPAAMMATSIHQPNKKLILAVQQLKIAKPYTKENTKKGRYLFIYRTIYNQLGHKAQWQKLCLYKVIDLNRKSPGVN